MVHWCGFGPAQPCSALMLMGDISLSPLYLLACTIEMKYLLVKVNIRKSSPCINQDSSSFK